MSSDLPEDLDDRQFFGLFVGINRYQSPDIGHLSSAVRDATGLHALFRDNLGEQCTLLTDAEATAARLRKELVRLQDESTYDDVVVVTFSGHGSDTHELVTYDTDPYQLAATALPLAELTDLLSAIQAKHLLVVLDCCFSGGVGAKVFRAPTRPRGAASGLPRSTEAFLANMAGTGRIILTAATADQEALEDTRVGHGILTYHLMQALLGPGDIAHNNQIHLLDLLKYVTQNVKASASSTARAQQEPTLRGQWDGEVLWPVFVRGPLYNALYPPATTAPVNSDLRSLAEYGLPDPVLDAWAGALPGLNRLQQDAINEAGLMSGRNVLVTAPTSSGKTMIGELAALRATQTGGRSVFLLPTKALVNEQYDRFRRTYGPVGVRVVRATGDHNDDVPALLRGQFDMAVFTYEKFSGLALAQPHLLRMISVVVVDEVQTIVDPSRGRELELLLTLIKSRKDEGIQPQLIALSAVLGDINGLDTWLHADLLRTDVRPVPLQEGVLDARGRYRYLDADGDEHTVELMPPVYGEPRAQTILVPLIRHLVEQGQQVIVIRGIRGEARGAAGYLAHALGLPPATQAIADLPDGDPTQSSALLRQCLQGGVAFHVSDLNAAERCTIEEQFRRPGSQIRVVVATTTLAQGINMPAETVIMPELNRRTGRDTYSWYSVAEYKNIAGRAGRLGLTERGRAIVLAFDGATANNVWNRYVKGTPEDVRSTLLGPDVDLYTIVLRVAAIAAQRSDDGSVAVDDLAAVLANSLAAHQARLTTAGDAFEPARVADAIKELQRVEFLDVVDDGRIRLSALGALVAASALSVRSGVRVADALRRVHPSQLNHATLLAVAQLTIEVDAVHLTVNTKGVQAELTTFLGGLSSRGTAPAVINALGQASDRPTVAARAKKAIACLLWINGVPSGRLEQFVMQHYKDRNAIGPIRAVVSRTHDVIDTVLVIAAELHPTANLIDLTHLLPVQLELGIPAAIAPVAVAGANLSRDEYLRLHDHGLTTPEAIDEADDTTLLALLQAGEASLQRLRSALRTLRNEADTPSLDELLSTPQTFVAPRDPGV